MEPRKDIAHRPRLRRTIILCSVCVTASALGMVLSRPVATHFLRVSPWILPTIGVTVLVLLAVTALVVLPKLTAPPR